MTLVSEIQRIFCSSLEGEWKNPKETLGQEFNLYLLRVHFLVYNFTEEPNYYFYVLETNNTGTKE